MVKITWLGEDAEDMPGPSFNIWNGIKFPKGQPVEVSDPYVIAKARTNQFYKVEEAKHEEEKEEKPSEGKTAKPEEAHRRQEEQEQQQKTGYSPVKKKPAKRKAPSATGADADARPSDDAA